MQLTYGNVVVYTSETDPEYQELYLVVDEEKQLGMNSLGEISPITFINHSSHAGASVYGKTDSEWRGFYQQFVDELTEWEESVRQDTMKAKYHLSKIDPIIPRCF
jgi:hypothetical protein